MPTPWSALPDVRHFVLPEDMPFVQAFNGYGQRSLDHQIRTECIPQPAFGPRKAPVVVLFCNPTFDAEELRIQSQDEYFRNALLADLRNEDPTEHFYLSENPRGPGQNFWNRATRELQASVGLNCLKSKLLSVEYSAYVSRNFCHSEVRLPSQGYSFGLVRAAISRNAVIICMRSKALWTYAIPELSDYHNIYFPNSFQAGYLTRTNLGDGYDKVLSALETLNVIEQPVHTSISACTRPTPMPSPG